MGGALASARKPARERFNLVCNSLRFVRARVGSFHAEPAPEPSHLLEELRTMEGVQMDTDHPPARICHSDGHTDVQYADQGSLIVTGGTNGNINLFKGHSDEDARTIEGSSDGGESAVTCTAVHDDDLVRASEDNSVTLFSVKTGEFRKILTRFQAPVRHVVFNSTGSCIAAGSDDLSIRVISTIDDSIKILRGHDGAILALAFAPSGKLLASSSADGTVRIWDIKTAECVKTLQVILRSNDRANSGLSRLSWWSNFLAIPVGKEVQVFEEGSWDVRFAFSEDGHSQGVSLCQWSPNGLYLVSVGVSGEIMVWETNNRQTVNCFRHPDKLGITGIAWHPHGNELAWAASDGSFSIWRNVIPVGSANLTAPTGGEGDVSEQQEIPAFSDDEDDVVKPHRRLRRSKAKAAAAKRASGDAMDADDDEDGVVSSYIPREKEADEGSDAGDALYQYGVPATVNVQEAFMPTSTPAHGLRRFLVWNSVGYISSRDEQTQSSVDVEFHDNGKHRPIHLTDHFGFTAGALGERALVLAAPSREPTADDERENPSTLYVQIFEHWASDATWQYFFPPGEEIEAIAIGEAFVAAITSKRYVRLYSLNGVPLWTFCIPGAVVSATAFESQLFVVYHGKPSPTEQNLLYLVLDIDKRKRLVEGALPLSPEAELLWLGYSEEGLPATADSEEVVRILCFDWDATWTPVAELKGSKKGFHWVTGLAENEVFCIVCKGEDTFPKVLPKPITTPVGLHLPIVSSKDFVAHEESFLRSKMNLEQVCRLDDLKEDDPDDAAELQSHRRKMDHHLIGCISKAVQAHKPGRALGLATLLTEPSSYDVAIKLAVKAKSPGLAERINVAKGALLEDRQLAIRARREKDQNQRMLMRTPQAYLRRPGYPSPAAEQPFGARRAKAQPDTGITFSDSEEEADEASAPAPQPQPSKPAASKKTLKAKAGSKPATLGGAAEQPRKKDTAPAPAPKAAAKKATGNPFAKKGAAAAAAPSKAGTLDRQNSLMGALTGEAVASPSKKRPAMSFLKRSDDTASTKKTGIKESNKKRRVAKPEKDPRLAQLKKPMTSFFMWTNDNREDLKKQFPGLKASQIASKAGELWKALEADQKQVYLDRYKAEKAAYQEAVARIESEIRAESAGAAGAARTAKTQPQVEEEMEAEPAGAKADAPSMEVDEPKPAAAAAAAAPSKPQKTGGLAAFAFVAKA